MIINGKNAEKGGLLKIAEFMCIAARTAPKARGIDNIISGIVTDADKIRIAEEMEKLVELLKDENFKRDASSVRKSELIVLIGTKIKPIGLNCGLCLHSCKEVEVGNAICGFNLNDLGIAVGSAVSVAKELCVDNRIMYRIGIAAARLKMLSTEVKVILGIPLSSTGKNIFFDR